jgi:hypothetical protein
VAALGSFIAVLMVAGCADTTVAGMTPTQTFSKPQTAQLVEAVMSGDYTKADKLLAQGVDVNAVSAEDLTPLLWVLSASHFDEKKLEYLLKAGANPNFQEKKHHASAMYFAVSNHNDSLLKLLLKHGGNPSLIGEFWGEDTSLLQVAAINSYVEIITILVNAGADVNYLDKRGRSAAFYLAENGRFDLVIYLMNHGLVDGLDALPQAILRNIQVHFKDEMQIWKDKVLAMLKERGAKFTLDKN